MPQVEGEATLPRDLSPWGMFMAADHVVKAVMISLALASVLSWTVWLAKSLELLGAKRRARTAIRALAQSHSLHEGTERLRKTGGPDRGFARAAETEIKLSADAIEKDGVKERVASRLERIEAAAGRRMNRGTGILATIGSIGPFVGPVRHRVGHHEQLYRHLEGADDKPRGRCARHRRSAARDGARPCGRHSGGGDLQRLLALDHRLSRDCSATARRK